MDNSNINTNSFTTDNGYSNNYTTQQQQQLQ
jgi:hypothetical protein